MIRGFSSAHSGSEDPPRVQAEPCSCHKIELGKGTEKSRKALMMWLAVAVGARIPELWP